MYTKSLIQQTVENLRAKDNFRVAIEQLMEKYNIEDSVFILKNGFIHEVVEGYFATIGAEYTTIDEAVSVCDINTMGIRVKENTFQVGKIYNRISECKDCDKVFDLKRLEDIR